MTDHNFLTAFSPIEYRHGDPDGTLAAVGEMLLNHQQNSSPFRHCPMVHMARLQIIDSLTPPMGDTSGQNLKTKYLLLAADIDGRVDDFLDCLYRVDADFVHAVWGRCIGYPSYEGAVFFRRYITRCEFKNPLGYAGFATSVEGNIRAVTRKNALADWVRCHQGLSDAELQQAWRRDRQSFVNPDTPEHGKL